MVVAVRAQPKAPMVSPAARMMSWRQLGSFWLKTGTPQDEPLLAPAVGAAVGALTGSTPVLFSPVADSTPCTMPTLSLAVQQSEAVWPRAKTLAGRSETLRGGCEPSARAAQTWKPAAWPAGARPTT